MEMGYVTQVSQPKPKYGLPPTFGQQQEMVVDLTAKVNGIITNYNMLPAQSDIADTYTFKSFNTLLSNYGEQCSFSGDIGGTTFPSWVRVNQNGDYLNVYANITGYFMISSGNSIRLYNANDLIATVKKNGTTTVYYYEMDTSTGKPVIKYDDLPSWLDFVLDTIDDGNQKVLSKISFILKKAGFVWKDKNTLFGKASWQKLTANTVLNELTWNNVKKAFIPTTGISTSTTATYTYRWLDHVVQYKPEEDSELTFKVEVPGNDFNSITIKSVVSGYFKIIVNGKIDAAEWVQIGDANSQIALIKGTDSFEIDYLESAPSYENEENWPDWLNPNPKLTYTKNPLMANKDFRKAVLEAVDTDTFVTSVMGTQGETLKSIIAPSLVGYTKAMEDSCVGYNPEDAKKVIEENGWTGQTVTMLVPTRDLQQTFAAYVQSQLQAVGLNVEIVSEEWASFLTSAKGSKNFDITMLSWSNVTGDGEQMLNPNFSSNNGVRVKYNNPEFDAEVTASAQTTVLAEREAHMLKAVEIIQGDAVVKPIFTQNSLYAYNSNKVATANFAVETLFHVKDFKLVK